MPDGTRMTKAVGTMRSGMSQAKGGDPADLPQAFVGALQMRGCDHMLMIRRPAYIDAAG